MTFLQPWYVPLIAAGLAIPPLVLLYFLKLKRREVPIASTLLWRRAVQDLQVNSPFQRLRSNLLLILQLLALLLAILAITEPMHNVQREFEQNVVIMVDRSASMAGEEEDGRTRLEIAREQAQQVVENMNPKQRAMVIEFADRARILTTFTDDKRKLHDAIDSITPTDKIGRLQEAMMLAEAHSAPVGENFVTVNELNMSQYMLFTDGRLTDAEQVRVERGELQVVLIGESTENVGIVDLDVRRHYEQPERLSILARVRNFGGVSATRDLSLFIDGQLKAVEQVGELAPLARADQLSGARGDTIPPDNNERVVPFELILDSGARVEVRLSGSDALDADDRAFAIVTPPNPMSVLLVTDGNFYLRQMMEAMPIEKGDWEIWSTAKYEAAKDGELLIMPGGPCKFDVVVLDNHSTSRLPPAGYLFFGGVPLVEGVEIGGLVRDGSVLDWDETHPVLRYGAIGSTLIVNWYDIRLPDNAVTLVEATNGPLMATLHEGRNDYLICAFSLFNESRDALNTDWVTKRGFVVFFYNALQYLFGDVGAGAVPSVAPGEAFTIAAAPDAKEITVTAPEDGAVDVPVRVDGLASFSGTDRVGVYETSSTLPGEQARAVNLCSDAESLIAPLKKFSIASGTMTTSEAVQRVNQPLWPYVLMVLCGLLFFEWFIYNKRVFI